MYKDSIEDKLIDPDVALLMQLRISIQLDIDDTKVKAAALVAQEIDLEEAVGEDVIERVVNYDDEIEADVKLRNKVIDTWLYFTHYRCLTMFNGSFTDSGYVIETDADTNDSALRQANTIRAIADRYLKKLIEFLDEEGVDNKDIDETKIAKGIRTMGGEENR